MLNFEVYAAVTREKKRGRKENSGENILILDIFCVIFSLGRGKKKRKEKKSEKFRQIFLVVFDIFKCEDPRAGH